MRVTSYPAGHWRMQVDIPYSMGVKTRGLFFLCGQADLKGQGEVQHAGDLIKQSHRAIAHIETIVEDLGCTMRDLAKLVVYYVNNGEVDELAYMDDIARKLDFTPLPAITMVPIRHFFYPGLMVEIDAFGFDGLQPDRRVFAATDTPFSAMIQQGGITLTGAVRPVSDSGAIQHAGDPVAQSHFVQEKLQHLLDRLAADRRDIVKINNWFVGVDNAEQWAQTAAIRAAWYPDPGPVATGMPLHALYPRGAMVQTECWMMQGPDGETLAKKHCWPDGHWQWPVPLPFKHGLQCGNFIFTGGQVSMDASADVIDPGNMPAQAKTSMQNLGRVLAGFGADFTDVVKMNCFYAGRESAEDLHTNLNIRSAFFGRPGPASTGIPLDNLCFAGMLTEFEAIAAAPGSE